MIERPPSYIYSMEKYSGCNIVESVVARAEKPKAKVAKAGRFGIFVRWIIAAVTVGIICMFAFSPIPAFSAARSALSRVFCYDVFGRSEFGGSVFSSVIGGM